MPILSRMLAGALLAIATTGALAGRFFSDGLPVPGMLLAGVAVGLGAFVHRSITRPMRRIAAALDVDQLHDAVRAAETVSTERARLESRIDQRTRLRTRELELVAKQRDEFLSNTVHELRTPLTTVMASIEMLKDGYVTTEEERTTFFDQAYSACHHMLFLVNDLLDTSAFEAGKLRIDSQEYYTHDLLEDARRILAPVALVKAMTLRIELPDEDTPVVGDPNRTLQVIFNMVGNGLKYAPSGTEVVFRAVPEAGHVLFEVQDQGIGVPEEKREGLFQRFSRVHSSSSSSASGTGIGLYLSKALIERMGGSVGYTPRDPGPGSVFWFRLPRAEVAAIAAD